MPQFALVAGLALMAAGTVAQYRNTIAAGDAERDAANFRAQLADSQALVLDQNAGQARASAQRGALEERRKGGLVESRARALAAAGGGSLDSPDLENILANIQTEADYRAGVATFEGEERARGMETAAMLKRAGGAGEIYAGEVARDLSRGSATAGLIGGLGKTLAMSKGLDFGKGKTTTVGGADMSLFDKYGGDGPVSPRSKLWG